ncbi:MAG: hypothetical protein NT099_07565 [Candidatus Saganbacteria bacterium]|nr:hypothetical protein [Candidatus Saganbacteria bacterium]
MPKIYFGRLLHCYQPVTEDNDRKVFAFPWARHHTVRDYDALVRYASAPGGKSVIELTGILLNIIRRYQNGWKDRAQQLTMIPAHELTVEEKVEILSNFFDLHKMMLSPLPRYNLLRAKRGENLDPAVLHEVASSFTTQDFLDLQVLFNLAWTGRREIRLGGKMRDLFDKARTADSPYTEDDKAAVLAHHDAMMRGVLDLYRGAQSEGLIEVATAPYYHPVMPLLIDTQVARMDPALGHVEPYSYPQDVRAQVQRAIDEYESVFGIKPSGMWPSEGGVSADVISLISRGFPCFQWMATDQGILERSTHLEHERDKWYPWQLGETNIALFFRDNTISNTFAFEFEENPAGGAMRILERLRKIAMGIPDGVQPPFVQSAGDGENPWDSRANLGEEYHETLNLGLVELEREGLVGVATPSEYLRMFPVTRRLERLSPGSWVDGNFSRWAGHPRANRMWWCLAQTRRELELAGGPERHPKAYEYILKAQTSCFFWWLAGVPGYDKGREEMDAIQRSYLTTALRTMGEGSDSTLAEELLVSTYERHPI